MAHLLKAMGFWIWGLVAIGLSITLVSVNYRAAFWHAQHSDVSTNPRALGAPDTSAGTTATRASTPDKAMDLRADIGRQFAETIAPSAVIDATANSPAGYLTMAEIYYKQKDCSRAVVWSDRAVAAFGATHRASAENALQIKLQCATDARNSSAVIAALSELIRLTNKTQYWNSLLRLVRSDLRIDRDVLLAYRIMYAVDAMSVDLDYIEMAQLLSDSGQLRQAQAVLDHAIDSGIVTEDHRERVRRLMDKYAARTPATASETPRYDAVTPDALQKLEADPTVSPLVKDLWQLYADTRWQVTGAAP